MTILIAVLSVIVAAVVIVALKEAYKPKPDVKKCGCGRSASGYCDGSHNNTAENSDKTETT